LARTEDVPLFTEELTKTVLESRLLDDAGDRYILAGPLPPLAILINGKLDPGRLEWLATRFLLELTRTWRR
jgi:hypothetical protein